MENAVSVAPSPSKCGKTFQSISRRSQSLLLGQLMSVCLSGTAITSQYLSNKKFNAPTAQNLPTYLVLFIIYGSALFRRQQKQHERRERNSNSSSSSSPSAPPPITSTNFSATPDTSTNSTTTTTPSSVVVVGVPDADSTGKEEFKISTILWDRGWKYALLALIDVEANFLMVYAYQFTNITAIQLLDCFTIPMVMLLSGIFLSARYNKRHYLAVAICFVGLALIIYTDAFHGSGLEGGSNKILGDLMCLLGTLLYAVSNVSEECLVKHYSRAEYLGLVGLFGFVISFLQVLLLESGRLAKYFFARSGGHFLPATTTTILLLLVLFTCSMVCFYSLVSTVMRKTSALLFNISALTADFYSLLASVLLFNQKFDILYAVAFVVIIVGTILYNYSSNNNNNENNNNN